MQYTLSLKIIKGDILISMMGTIGKCQVVPKRFTKGIIDSHLIKLSVQQEKVNPHYVRMIIDEAQYIKDILKYNSKGSIMEGLNSTIIKSLPLIISTIEEQELILEFINFRSGEIDLIIDNIQIQIKRLKEAKQSLITEAVTGKIEVLD